MALEFALLLPLVALALLLVLQLVAVGGDVLAVQDMARQGARVAAVDRAATVRRLVAERLPTATVTITTPQADVVGVSIAHTVELLGRPVVVTGQAVAAIEPGG